MAIFTGAGVALVTPFREDGSVNFDKLDELIDFHCENGTDSLIICGTTGESSTLSEEEHMDASNYAVERAKGRLPVIAGTGSNATYTTIDMSREAVEDGADGLLIVTPYYNKATQSGSSPTTRRWLRRRKPHHHVQRGEPHRAQHRAGDGGDACEGSAEHRGA